MAGLISLLLSITAVQLDLASMSANPGVAAEKHKTTIYFPSDKSWNNFYDHSSFSIES